MKTTSLLDELYNRLMKSCQQFEYFLSPSEKNLFNESIANITAKFMKEHGYDMSGSAILMWKEKKKKD
jgi:hypothetical protein